MGRTVHVCPKCGGEGNWEFVAERSLRHSCGHVVTFSEWTKLGRASKLKDREDGVQSRTTDEDCFSQCSWLEGKIRCTNCPYTAVRGGDVIVLDPRVKGRPGEIII